MINFNDYLNMTTEMNTGYYYSEAMANTFLDYASSFDIDYIDARLNIVSITPSFKRYTVSFYNREGLPVFHSVIDETDRDLKESMLQDVKICKGYIMDEYAQERNDQQWNLIT